METAIAIGIAFAILIQGFMLMKKQNDIRKRVAELKKVNEDLNIEFGAMEGTGIHQVRKSYPDIEMKDDHREEVSEPTKVEK